MREVGLVVVVNQDAIPVRTERGDGRWGSCASDWRAHGRSSRLAGGARRVWCARGAGRHAKQPTAMGGTVRNQSARSSSATLILWRRGTDRSISLPRSGAGPGAHCRRTRTHGMLCVSARASFHARACARAQDIGERGARAERLRRGRGEHAAGLPIRVTMTVGFAARSSREGPVRSGSRTARLLAPLMLFRLPKEWSSRGRGGLKRRGRARAGRAARGRRPRGSARTCVGGGRPRACGLIAYAWTWPLMMYVRPPTRTPTSPSFARARPSVEVALGGVTCGVSKGRQEGVVRRCPSLQRTFSYSTGPAGSHGEDEVAPRSPLSRPPRLLPDLVLPPRASSQPPISADLRAPCPPIAESPQADVISRVDDELRKEMVEAQAQVARWVTEQKRHADTVALKGQRMLQTDKGAPLAQPLPPALTCGSRRAPMCRATAAHCLRAKPRCLRSVRVRNACLHAVIECDADTRPTRFA